MDLLKAYDTRCILWIKPTTDLRLSQILLRATIRVLRRQLCLAFFFLSLAKTLYIWKLTKNVLSVWKLIDWD